MKKGSSLPQWMRVYMEKGNSLPIRLPTDAGIEWDWLAAVFKFMESGDLATIPYTSWEHLSQEMKKLHPETYATWLMLRRMKLPSETT